MTNVKVKPKTSVTAEVATQYISRLTALPFAVYVNKEAWNRFGRHAFGSKREVTFAQGMALAAITATTSRIFWTTALAVISENADRRRRLNKARANEVLTSMKMPGAPADGLDAEALRRLMALGAQARR
jgi:hypothetical protein